MQAGALAKGGEVFMLDMGEQVKIEELARDMIRLSGLCPGEDIEIKFVGVRPGEKLCEELLAEREKAVITKHQRIFVVENGVVDQQLVDRIVAINRFPTVEQLSELMDSVFLKFNWLGSQQGECGFGGKQDA